ncbi:hypothetical protein CUZ93_0466 [Enterococcus xinjiangensis]|nr:hypothetical protein [Enterococcus faecium]MBL4993814.1 hypothetical protein [Enterococcus lactis]MBK4836966.1 hypothetical protein [Enterococcus faecium]MBK4854059.1 hypothetical protein [Enterococcus faecium]MBK4864270.1 hypothetical protein [Enterococcus faecium]
MIKNKCNVCILIKYALINSQHVSSQKPVDKAPLLEYHE